MSTNWLYSLDVPTSGAITGAFYRNAFPEIPILVLCFSTLLEGGGDSKGYLEREREMMMRC